MINLVKGLFLLILCNLLFTACNFGVDDPILKRIDTAIKTIGEAQIGLTKESDKWREALMSAKEDISGLANNLTGSAKQIAKETTSDLEEMLKSTDRLVEIRVKDSVAVAGIEVRCGVSFLKSGLLGSLNRLKAKILKTQILAEPKVCHISPDVLILERGGTSGTWSANNPKQVNIYGYNFEGNNLPKVGFYGSNNQFIRESRIKPTFITVYQLQLDFSIEDFANLKRGLKIGLSWTIGANAVNMFGTQFIEPASLQIIRVSYPNSIVVTLTPVQLAVTVTNKSEMDSQAFDIIWKPTRTELKTTSVNRLAAGETKTYTLDSFIYKDVGSYITEVSIRSINAKDEVGESSFVRLEVRPLPPPPVTYITGLDFTYWTVDEDKDNDDCHVGATVFYNNQVIADGLTESPSDPKLIWKDETSHGLYRLDLNERIPLSDVSKLKVSIWHKCTKGSGPAWRFRFEVDAILDNGRRFRALNQYDPETEFNHKPGNQRWWSFDLRGPRGQLLRTKLISLRA